MYVRGQFSRGKIDFPLGCNCGIIHHFCMLLSWDEESVGQGCSCISCTLYFMMWYMPFDMAISRGNEEDKQLFCQSFIVKGGAGGSVICCHSNRYMSFGPIWWWWMDSRCVTTLTADDSWGVSERLEKQLVNTGLMPQRFAYYNNRNWIWFSMIDEVIKKQRDSEKLCLPDCAWIYLCIYFEFNKNTGSEKQENSVTEKADGTKKKKSTFSFPSAATSDTLWLLSKYRICLSEVQLQFSDVNSDFWISKPYCEK